MTSAVLFSRASDEWTTPPDLFCALRDEFGDFDLDAAATEDNALAPVWFSRDRDALVHPWHGTVWLNPPYSKCREFLAKAAEESRKGCTVVCSSAEPYVYALVAQHRVGREHAPGPARCGGALSARPAEVWGRQTLGAVSECRDRVQAALYARRPPAAARDGGSSIAIDADHRGAFSALNDRLLQ